MPSVLAWIDHDSKARERTLRILSLFQEKESRDELGLGSVRDSFADQLFPGTSTIQTRLRYMLFVPWIYHSLEEKRLPAESFAIQADLLERDLVQPLMDSDDLAGVFGKTAGKSLKRLPSSVYWAGLGTWGIRLTPFSQDEYHRRIDEAYRRRHNLKALEKDAKVRGDDVDLEQRMATLSWHPRLPAPPEEFPSKVDFALSREEAEFVWDRIQVACPNSLLSFLVLHCEPADTHAPWAHPDYANFSDQHKELLTHARLFSEVMHGAALSYNVQLARLRNHDELVAEHQASFDEWTANFPLEEIRAWSVSRLWEMTIDHGHSVTPQTRSFVQQWIDHTRKSPKDLLANTEALNLIKRREMKLKGTRSRFRNQRALEQWGGYSGVGRLVYRWPNVQVLLNDLYQGMNRGAGMLNPNFRSLYTSALTPPPGMIFDEAVATTFSMDPALLLEAPVYLALMAADGQTDPDPLAVLEAIRRYSKRITVYVQRGRIQVPQIAKPNPLFGFLEDMVVEVTAPGGGVFHPKVWAIRFVSPDQSSSMYRLVVLTRNMTTDQSWDLSLQLEGSIAGRKSKSNKPLAHFFNMLPGLAIGSTEAGRVEQALRFAEAMHRVQWELPDGFDELTFYLPGTQGFDWEPPEANRMAVISPFCSDQVLQTLAKQSKAADALISRPESLSGLKPETLALFTHCLQLDEAAETEDGEEDDTTAHPLATGLHAKVYLFETRYYSDYTHVIMGSANATNAALNAAKNIEIMVGLVGKKSKVGGIDELLGADGLGEYLVDFDTGKETLIDAVRKEAEDCVERARSRLSEVALAIECNPGTKEGLWALLLTGKIPSLDGIVSAGAWPITVTRDFSVNVKSNDAHDPIRLGEFSSSSVTGLIAFELKTLHPDVTARFVLNLPVTGIPEERDSAILQTVISNRDGFIRYLLLLLGDDWASGLDSGNGAGWAKWLARLAVGEDIPLLEELTRTYSRHPQRLSEISGLVGDLSRGTQNNIIPEDFLNLWSVFESAIGARDV